MDVDLSTDLAALLPAGRPAAPATPTSPSAPAWRRGARVVRGAKRELISRCYNLLLRTALGARFTDAQCGFKAIRADAAAALLPLVEDTGWFFDTELLVLAERRGLRIHEVPVDWVDDPDSRVAVAATALADLRGVARLLARPGPRPARAGRRGRPRPATGLPGQLLRFAGVGVGSARSPTSRCTCSCRDVLSAPVRPTPRRCW